ncbi:MAG: peptide chain release factor N(5)-glutamine methyltransferase [Pseudomonadota bacterium]
MSSTHSKPRSIAEWRQHARIALAVLGDDATLEADWLISEALDLSRAQLLTRGDVVPTDDAQARLDEWLAQRADNVPLAYLTGSQPFLSLMLEVTRDTLVPRADTEILVERALARIPPAQTCRIADLGTGSGAIALAIARARPLAQIVASDLSRRALAVAQRNAQRLGLGNVTFHCGNWFEALPTRSRFDLIVSNPPYVEQDFDGLQTHLKHEPRQALAAGTDGLDALRAIITGASKWLTPGGWLLLEHGYQQADAVSGILRTCSFTDIQCFDDRGARPRVSEARTL